MLFRSLFAAAGGDVARQDEVMDLLELKPLLKRRTFELSGGERQRVALGRALLARPDVLLLDEPLASLDQARREHLLRHIERLVQDGGVQVVYVSHDWREIENLCDYALIFDAGSLLTHGHPKSLKQK